MVLTGPGGQPLELPADQKARVQFGPLKIGRVVHACDGEHCAPLLINIVNDRMAQIIGGKVMPYGPVVDVVGVPHKARPDLPPTIEVPGPTPTTWHWPGECPWER